MNKLDMLRIIGTYYGIIKGGDYAGYADRSTIELVMYVVNGYNMEINHGGNDLTFFTDWSWQKLDKGE